MPSASRQDWVPRLSDLGISRLCPELAVGHSHVTSRLLGTAGYMAPEVMQGTLLAGMGLRLWVRGDGQCGQGYGWVHLTAVRARLKAGGQQSRTKGTGFFL